MAEKAQEFVLKRIVSVAHNPLENRIIEIDNEAADGGGKHTFNEWTEFQNNKGMAVASMADVYQEVKAGNKKFIRTMRKDMEEKWVILNPKTNYKDNLLADIIHYDGSKVTNQIICRDLFVPVWRNAPLYDVLETEEGLVYFQVSDGTGDNAKNIKKTFYELSGCKADKTMVWTPEQDNRKDYPARAYAFSCNSGEFHVGGYHSLDGSGRSRGVCISAEGASQKNSTGN